MIRSNRAQMERMTYPRADGLVISGFNVLADTYGLSNRYLALVVIVGFEPVRFELSLGDEILENAPGWQVQQGHNIAAPADPDVNVVHKFYGYHGETVPQVTHDLMPTPYRRFDAPLLTGSAFYVARLVWKNYRHVPKLMANLHGVTKV